jgi:hypothetical protein
MDLGWSGLGPGLPSFVPMLMTSSRGTSPEPPGTPGRPSLVRRVTWRRVLGAGLVAVSLVGLCSYGQALVYPGQASLSVRTVEWIRDNGGGALVDAVENWWYTRDAPPTSAPEPAIASHAPVVPPPGAPAPLAAIGPHLAPGEGAWAAGPPTGNGRTPMLVTYVRPDPVHPGVLAGVARFDQNQVKAQVIAGTREPDQQSWPEGGQVPPGQRAALVATFNSGFKMADAQGGFYADGRMARPLRDGAASLVIDSAGKISVDSWGRDRHFGPDIAAVRQNLALIVDDGVPVPGLAVNRDNRWGSAKNQLQYTWRSAAGVDTAGNLYFVAGDKLTLATLARALADTGASRGMELDIHPAEVHLFAYRHDAGAPGPVPTALLADMPGPTDRYLRPDQRDFVALTAR